MFYKVRVNHINTFENFDIKLGSWMYFNKEYAYLRDTKGGLHLVFVQSDSLFELFIQFYIYMSEFPDGKTLKEVKNVNVKQLKAIMK